MKILLLSVLLVLLSTCGFAQAPESWTHSTTSYVNDFAHAFTPDQVQNLDRIMRNFHDTVQITIVTIPTLAGLDRSEYAVRLGNQWGVGSHSNNGLLILICPPEHEFFTATGGGIQGDLTDLQAAHWFDELAKPKYKEGDMYGGTLDVLNKYIDVLSPSAKVFRVAQEKAEAEHSAHIRSDVAGKVGYALAFILAFILIGYGIVAYRRKKAKEAAELDEIKGNFTKASDAARTLQIKNEKYQSLYPEAVTLKNNFITLGLYNRQDFNWTKDQYLAYIGNYEKYVKDNQSLNNKLANLITLAAEKEQKEREAAKLRVQTIEGATNLLRHYTQKSGDTLVLEREMNQKMSYIFTILDAGLQGMTFDHGDYHAKIAELKTFPDLILNECIVLSKLIQDEATTDAIAASVTKIEAFETRFESIHEECSNIISDDNNQIKTANNAKDNLETEIARYEKYIGKTGVSAQANETTKNQCAAYRNRLNDFNGLSILEMYALYMLLSPKLNEWCGSAKQESDAYEAEEQRKAEVERQRLATIAAEAARVKREEEDRQRRKRQEEEDEARRMRDAASAAIMASSIYSSTNNDSISSSSSASSFGGGSFDGGGGGGSW